MKRPRDPSDKKMYYVIAAKRSTRRQLNPLQSYQGVLLSCDTAKIRECIRETYNILNEYQDSLVEEQQQQQADATAKPDQPSKTAPTDVSAALAKEVAELESESEFGNFQSLDVSIKGLAFIEFALAGAPHPVEYVRGLYESIRRGGKAKTKFLHRMVPIQRVCSANTEAILANLTPLVEQVFHAPGSQPQKFAVQIKSRLSELHASTLVHPIAQLVKSPPHTVDLSNPETVIVVEILKGACMLAVVPRYSDFSKFNIRSLTPNDKTDDADDKPAPSQPSHGKKSISQSRKVDTTTADTSTTTTTTTSSTATEESTTSSTSTVTEPTNVATESTDDEHEK